MGTKHESALQKIEVSGVRIILKQRPDQRRSRWKTIQVDPIHPEGNHTMLSLAAGIACNKAKRCEGSNPDLIGIFLADNMSEFLLAVYKRGASGGVALRVLEDDGTEEETPL